jgi:hypothetical protein
MAALADDGFGVVRVEADRVAFDGGHTDGQ